MGNNPKTEGELIEYFKTVDTPTLANAVEVLNIRRRQEGFTPCDIRCIFPEFGRMCGWAATAQVETITEANAHDPTGFQQLFHAVDETRKPTVVVFQELGARPEYAVHCGEIVATVLSRLGAVGMITDGGVRDLPEVRAVRFHLFARGAAASHARFRIVRVGVPVQILGMTVQPGDFLHGDENGVLQVPAEHVAKLPAAVDAVRAAEQPLLEFARGPNFDIDQLVARFLH